MSEKLITVEQWNKTESVHGATPKCPDCDQHLSIKLWMFTNTMRDEWECDKCKGFKR